MLNEQQQFDVFSIVSDSSVVLTGRESKYPMSGSVFFFLFFLITYIIFQSIS